VTDSQIAGGLQTTTETALLKAADDQLLEAKRHGRSRVIGPASAWPATDQPAPARAAGS
jgi:hypothetical protein